MKTAPQPETAAERPVGKAVFSLTEPTKSPRELMHDELSSQVERRYGPPARRRSRRQGR